MKVHRCGFVDAAGVRRVLVPPGDIRGEVAFQNDINLLLARFEGPLSDLQAPGPPPVTDTASNGPAVIRRGIVESAKRLFDGGGGRPNPVELPRRASGSRTS